MRSDATDDRPRHLGARDDLLLKPLAGHARPFGVRGLGSRADNNQTKVNETLMRKLADYLLKANGVEVPVSAPVLAQPRHDLPTSNRPNRVKLGFAAQDVGAARRLAGEDARLLTNIHLPGREVGRLRVLDVDTRMFRLLAEVSPLEEVPEHGRGADTAVEG